jgi:hypothetical protein
VAIAVGSVALLELVENAVTSRAHALVEQQWRHSHEESQDRGDVDRHVKYQRTQHDRDVPRKRTKQVEPEPRRHAEYQPHHAVRRQPHGYLDNLYDDVIDGFQHAQHRLCALRGDQREGRPEQQREEDQAEKVEVNRRLDGVARHDVDEGLDPERRLRRGLHLR